MVVNENLLIEIVRPGTGEPVPDGEVGEVVVTTFNPDYPMIRLATGDLSAVMAGRSSCGRTNTRIRGWMGRADQTTKVKGMFVRPEQVAELARRHPELGRVRLKVTRAQEQDVMTLLAEAAHPVRRYRKRSPQRSRRLPNCVAVLSWWLRGSLPNDGKVIADERPVG
jgi:Coenzyme F390 synthetase